MEPSSRKPLLELAQEHMGLLISAGLATTVVFRLLSLAQWNTQTAAAILQYSGSTNVVVAAAVSAFPYIFTTALWFAGGALFYRWTKDRAWPGY